MPVSILVATPHSAFGDLLRDSLLDQQDYQVSLAASGKEARALSASGAFELAILDAAVDERFVPLCKEILAQHKGIRLLVIPPENNPSHPTLGGLMPHGYLSRPFYLPDLIETVTRLLYERESEIHQPVVLPAGLPDWLQDAYSLRQYLEELLPQTQALAALVGVHSDTPGSGNLQVNVGALNDPAALEVTGVVFRYWNADEKTDLMRFLRLATDKNDYLIYATNLIENVVLILVYHTNAPLSQIRPQTRHVSQQLLSAPPVLPRPGTEETVLPPASAIAPAEAPEIDSAPAAELASPEESSPIPLASLSAEPLTQPLDDTGYLSHLRTSFLSFIPEDLEEESAAEAERIDLSALLGSIPSPDPQNDRPGSGSRGDSAPKPYPAIPFSPSIVSDRLTGWQVADFDAEGNVQTPVEPGTAITRAEKAPLPVPPVERGLMDEPDIDPLEDTRPHVVAALTNLGQLEPVSAALSLLNYTCVLVPRLPQHYLTGELADRLSQWVQQLCLAFGWRLEGISIRPEYLQWTVQVAPSISPGNLVRIIRQRTSLHIFKQFTHLEEQNPSGDFWATGYLIVSGAQPPSAQLLRDYIAQTRKRQGISR